MTLSIQSSTRLEDLQAEGRALRKTLPRARHMELPRIDRDPVAILERQHEDRLSELVPIRIGRMLQSPFAFYRGSAAIMAGDLATVPSTDIEVISCGDAHVANFGLFATPERALTFDLDDFDEASNAPWEWDVKRLASSAVVSALDGGVRPDQAQAIAAASINAYRQTLSAMMKLTTLERFYYRADHAWLLSELDPNIRPVVEQTAAKARLRTADHVLQRIELESDGGGVRIAERRPILVRDPDVTRQWSSHIRKPLLKSMRSDAAMLMGQFEPIDVVQRIVGVGSIGTRCYLQLLVDPTGAPLFLQAKEAGPSVLETFGGRKLKPWWRLSRQRAGFHGFRVIAFQRILQAVSDPFLGYFGARGRDYYVRQFRDMSASIDLTRLTADQFEQYARLCATMLARAHSQSPRAGVIEGYLGSGQRFEQAATGWVMAYADVVQRDFELLQTAVRKGRLPAEHGV